MKKFWKKAVQTTATGVYIAGDTACKLSVKMSMSVEDNLTEEDLEKEMRVRAIMLQSKIGMYKPQQQTPKEQTV